MIPLDEPAARVDNQSVRKKRGFSLALVLLAATMMLLVGTAMAALSSVSLNMAAQLLSRARAEAVARGVVAEISYEFDQRVWRRKGWPKDWPDLAFGSDAVRKRMTERPLFPQAESRIIDGDLLVWCDFTSPTWFSVDNLTMEVPRASYADRGTARASVPPFSLDLMINTAVGDRASYHDVHHFEALVSRVWPYAAYCLQAPITVGGGSRLRGSLYDLGGVVDIGERGEFMADNSSPARVQGNVCVSKGLDQVVVQSGSVLMGRVLAQVPPCLGAQSDDPMALFDTSVPGDKRNPMDVYGQSAMTSPPIPSMDPFSQGPPGGGFTPLYEADPKKLVYASELQAYLATKWPDAVPMPKEVQAQTNALLSRVTIWRGNPPEAVKDLNQYRGSIRFRLPGVGSAFGVPPPRPDASGPPPVPANGTFGAVRVLVDSMTLNGGLFTSGPLTNHFGVVSGGRVVDDLWTGNKDGPSSITLKDSVLWVQGDLDIRDLRGDNSTLYVDGNLFLNGGSLDAKDKGMLILADNIVMEATGDFRGVIAARNVMTLKPLQSGERLLIRGGVLAGGRKLKYSVRNAAGEVSVPAGTTPLEIMSTSLLHDSRYTRSLNRLGTSRAMIFRELF